MSRIASCDTDTDGLSNLKSLQLGDHRLYLDTPAFRLAGRVSRPGHWRAIPSGGDPLDGTVRCNGRDGNSHAHPPFLEGPVPDQRIASEQDCQTIDCAYLGDRLFDTLLCRHHVRPLPRRAA